MSKCDTIHEITKNEIRSLQGLIDQELVQDETYEEEVKKIEAIDDEQGLYDYMKNKGWSMTNVVELLLWARNDGSISTNTFDELLTTSAILFCK